MKRGVLLMLLLWPCASCVGYVRTRIDEPVPVRVLNALRPGADGLGDCLAALGAPDQVYEYRSDGAALLWTWSDEDDWSVDFSLPVYDRASARFELDFTDTERPGCVLWFGPDLMLESWRSGTLGDVLRARVRPTVVE